jgi:hypothetical protein
MALSISLSPQAEAKLMERAAAAGADPTALAAQLLERAVEGSEPPNLPHGTGDVHAPAEAVGPGAAASAAVREFDAVMEELFGSDTQSLPCTTLSYSRADIYFDHD